MSSIFEYTFMQNAFLAILLITPLLGLCGTMVVHKQMAYFSDALGHSALTGIAVGIIFGIHNVNLSMIIFGVVFALVLNQIKFKTHSSVDTVISVCASGSLAFGLAILSKGGNFASYSSLLVGDVLSITRKEIAIIAVTAVIVIIYWIFALNSLVAVSIHPTLAKSRRMHVKLIENLFAVIIAVLVMLSIRWIGILLINALLILPAASAKNISVNMRTYHLYTILIALFCGICGLFVSYYTNVATGPVIVIYATVFYLITYLKKE